MIFLNFTAELDESWNIDEGTTQQVVVKINNTEVARFKPRSYIHQADQDGELIYEVAAWIRGMV